LDDQEPERPDWVHLPTGIEVHSLWNSPHDSALLSCESDLYSRTVTLRFITAHLVPNNPDIRFDVVLSEVTSARAVIQVRWPGEYVRPSGISREEEEPLIREYWSKWREQSLGWAEFEAALHSNTLDIGDASLAIGLNGRTMRIGGMLDGDTFDDQYCEACIAFKDLSIRSSENVALSLEEFDQLGVTFWEEFAKRASKE